MLGQSTATSIFFIIHCQYAEGVMVGVCFPAIGSSDPRRYFFSSLLTALFAGLRRISASLEPHIQFEFNANRPSGSLAVEFIFERLTTSSGRIMSHQVGLG